MYLSVWSRLKSVFKRRSCGMESSELSRQDSETMYPIMVLMAKSRVRLKIQWSYWMKIMRMVVTIFQPLTMKQCSSLISKSLRSILNDWILKWTQQQTYGSSYKVFSLLCDLRACNLICTLQVLLLMIQKLETWNLTFNLTWMASASLQNSWMTSRIMHSK